MPPPYDDDDLRGIQNRNWRVQSWWGTDENGNRIELPAPPDPPDQGATARNYQEILQRLDRIETFYRGQQEAEVMRTLLTNLGNPYHRAGEQISEELISHSPLLQLFVRRMQEYGFVRRLRAGVVTIMPPVNSPLAPSELRRMEVQQSRVPEPEVFLRSSGTVTPDLNGDSITPGLCQQLMEEASRLYRMPDDGSERERPDAPDGSEREELLSPPSSEVHYRELIETERPIPEEIGEGEEL